MIRGLALASLVLCSCQCVDPSELEECRREVARLESELAERDGVLARTAAQMEEEQRHLIENARAGTRRFQAPPTPPLLEGAVTESAKGMVTIRISANPGDVDIQKLLEDRPFTFAVYGDNGYKGEAVATKYESGAEVVLCRIVLRKGEATIEVGDKASTRP